MDVFEQINNFLDEVLKNELKIYMVKFLTPEKGTLPKDILEGFAKEAIKRNIIDSSIIK